MRIILTILLLVLTASCSAKPSEAPKPKTLKAEILGLSLVDYPQAEVSIDNKAQTVDISLPYGSTLGKTVVNLTLSEGISSQPEDGEVVDLKLFRGVYLSDPKGNAVKYSVSITVKASSNTKFYSVEDKDYFVVGEPIAKRVELKYPYGADLSSVSFTVSSKDPLTFEPDICSGVDLSKPLKVKAIAPDGVASDEYEFRASYYPKDSGPRAVYLPSPSHTDSFLSYEKAAKSIDLMASLGFDHLYLCCWAASKTAWDSHVLLSNSTYSSEREGNMYSGYTGGTGDALQDILTLAHSKGIKVVLWFEYGFMHSIGGVKSEDPVYSKHPEWIGLGNDGKYSAYNGNDYYYNAYDPEVQDFMLSLMKEALSLYPSIDGVQGDDRLPAMPRNSGYNPSTLALYKALSGKDAPSDYNDAAWVRWRLDNLNAFAGRMHDELKALKGDLLVCFAPNKYPWCETNLMQDWPAWVAAGNVDLLTVQFYVLPSYENDVTSALKYLGGRNILNPAMILKNGPDLLGERTLAKQLLFNRSVGTFGEAQFWFDGLWDERVQKIFRRFYH